MVHCSCCWQHGLCQHHLWHVTCASAVEGGDPLDLSSWVVEVVAAGRGCCCWAECCCHLVKRTVLFLLVETVLVVCWQAGDQELASIELRLMLQSFWCWLVQGDLGINPGLKGLCHLSLVGNTPSQLGLCRSPRVCMIAAVLLCLCMLFSCVQFWCLFVRGFVS